MGVDGLVISTEYASDEESEYVISQLSFAIIEVLISALTWKEDGILLKSYIL